MIKMPETGGVRVNFTDMEGNPWIYGIIGSTEEEVQEVVNDAEVEGNIVNSYVEEFKQSFKADMIMSLSELKSKWE